MQFTPTNPIVHLCIRGMALEAQGQTGAAQTVFLQAWNEAAHDFERYLAAYYLARTATDASEQLTWLEAARDAAASVDDVAVRSGMPALYRAFAACYTALGDAASAAHYTKRAEDASGTPYDAGPFYHGTRANLRTGDLLTPGFGSNYQDGLQMNHIYFTALPNGAGLAAALAKGETPQRVYIVEPTGSFEHDPNVTDVKFPGNPTRSYRTAATLRIVGELNEWERTSEEQVRQWRERLAASEGKIIN
ncbi:MAG: NAD(+)--rifampin ADP-ribosyltransferase [Chitinophagaceae bacterium]|nr:MAG: NAD(+)--rifampin ADP-ribosyltransferase [Chitinophagaceae bacterium]